ncbi:FAD-dependent oxidoreductase [Mesorhizobium sp. CGMCC 1.15528]|uniref:FAD-dependent oxidoreductase n=1 Tax=Mesorhizobium zhangyense TaxID=1776730 RepID=A0A7C9RAV1_9HYPH|nr:D-amino acid dehydrogenase [Mesorhizobium zhangyense]NGN44521.1 FAD-dependent oxidoreductase [Mesorhizobium zhangyense]
MRVAVLGAGVVGVTTAYELARDGHEVTVIDRLSEVAGETSFANAGLIAPGHAYTWSSPKAPRILLRSLFDDSQALRFKPSLDPRLWSWSWKFLTNCTAEKARTNTKRKVRLCRYSQERLQGIVADTGVDYHGLDGGLLYLYRKPESLARGSANTRILSEEGLELRAVSPDEAARIDPTLATVKDKFAGAVYCPSDGSGDARVFTQNLARHCAEKLGVKFMFDTEVKGFETGGDRIARVTTSKGPVAADEFVLCLGVFAPDFARRLGVSLPVYPIKGYSVTMPIEADNLSPTIGGVDEDNLVAYARFGDRLRVTATAEFAGFDRSHKPEDFRHMLAAIRDIFPNGADYARPQYWAGLRPMTPEGTPILGRGGRFANMVFNVGHGHMGWTMSAGSARITADIVKRAKPGFDPAGMLVQ